MRRISEFLIGLVFGSGLLLGGMTDPSKVKGFLDITGIWDPSLAFVMGGAVIVSAIAFRYAKPLKQSLFGRVIMLGDLKAIDLKLVGGSMIFGIGWGLSGFCPGPAIASLGTGEWKAALFVLAMAGGMMFAHFVMRPRER
jgi:uncharacterized membrane protein YedE/YeeE